MGIHDYTLVKLLGSGSFGRAHLATKNDSGAQVVVKAEVEYRLNENSLNTEMVIFRESSVITLRKQIVVTDLDKAKRDAVYEEFRLLSNLKDISIVR